jgi:NAD(P)H-hydrate epimerase
MADALACAPTAQLPLDLYRADQVRGFDRAAIEGLGIPGAILMARAGEAALRALRARWPEARRLAVVCGAGNNGGDGYVLARLARQQGLDPRVLAVADPARLRGDALDAATAARDAGVPFADFDPGPIDEAQVLVDALFGTGLDRPLEGPWAGAVDAVRASGRPVLALDLPSGLHADSGRVLGAAVRAAVTVTFVALKPGLFTGEGPAHCGRVLFHDLGVPRAVLAGALPAARRLDARALAQAWLAPRARDAHKGCFGHVLVVGGDHGYAGAARLAAEAAARCGAGLVSLGTRPEHVSAAVAARPEVMARGVEGGADLEALLARATVVALGPGLGRGPWGQGLALAALASGLPLVVDADALGLLPEGAGAGRVLTPHPGEAARMLGWTAAAVQADRLAAAAALRARFGGVVVLKGSGTVVDDGDGAPGICDRGNPGMATGGMGDLLTGVIAALLAQGLPPGPAARLGVSLHASAADRAAQEGERGLLAGDLLAHLRTLANPGAEEAGHGV